MATKDKIKVLEGKERQEWLNLTDEFVHLDFLYDNFSFNEKDVRKYNPRDQIKINLKKFNGESKDVITTLGRYVFNVFINNFPECKIFSIIGYINEPLTNKVIEKIDQKLASAVLDDEMTVTELKTYINKRDWLGYTLSNFINPSLNIDLIENNPEVMKLKKELLKKYKKEIETDPINTIGKIEKQLTDFAKEHLKDSPSMDLYASGCRGKFDDYRLTSIMRGVVQLPNGKYDYSTTSLSEGIKQDELQLFNNIMVVGCAGRSQDTAKGGYQSKIITSSFQTYEFDEKDTDCGTIHTLPILVTQGIYDNENLLYRYLVYKNKLVFINKKEDLKPFINRVVQLRSPMFCISEKICNKCAGDLYFKLEADRPSLLFSLISEKLKNISMKGFHSTAVKNKQFDLNDYIN